MSDIKDTYTEECMIKDIIPSGKLKLKIICENCEDFVLYRREAYRCDLSTGKVIEAHELHEIFDKILLPRAKKRALHLLEKQDYTTAKLKEKLKRDAYPDSIIQKTLSYLTERGFLDDKGYAQRYAELYCKRQSRRMISAKLLQKGIPKEYIECALMNALSDERQMIRAFLNKKNYNASCASDKEKQRLVRALLYRGYSFEDIKCCMDYAKEDVL